MRIVPNSSFRLKPLVVGGILLIPLWLTGFSENSPYFFPRGTSQIFRCAGVFENFSATHPVYSAEIRLSPSSLWVKWDSETEFKAKPWGNKTRFQDLVPTLQGNEGNLGREELSQWILHRFPGTDSLSEIRFIRTGKALTGPTVGGFASEVISTHQFKVSKANP